MCMYTHTDTNVLPHHSHLKQWGTITILSQMVKETQSGHGLPKATQQWRCGGHGNNTVKGGGHWHSHLTRQVSELEKHVLHEVSQ